MKKQFFVRNKEAADLPMPLSGNSILKNIIFLLFLISPLLANISAFSGVSWGDLGVIIFTCWFLLFCNTIKWRAIFSVLFVCVLSAFVIAYYSTFFVAGVLPVVRMCFYFVCFFVLVDFYRLAAPAKLLCRCYLYIASIFAVMLVFQVLIYKFAGVVIIYIETPYDIEINSIRALGVDVYGMRSGGAFKEPSYYVLFMIPALLYSANDKNFVLWFFYSVSVVLSTSVLGFLFVGITFLRFFSGSKLRSLVVALCAPLAFLASYSLGLLPDRVLETVGGGGSFSVRLTEPFVYIFLNFEKFIIPGFLNFDSGSVVWLNSLSYILILFGASSYILLFLVLWFSGESTWLVLLLLLLTNSFSGPYFLVIVMLVRILSNEPSVYRRNRGGAVILRRLRA
ncbi:hypothetical protein [Metapseudomonas otitidis]|uniref:hypothetical protein n=1 Tax=Metapseudomonas otitidis TaxID=319939 RepID=UPI00366C71DE